MPPGTVPSPPREAGRRRHRPDGRTRVRLLLPFLLLLAAVRPTAADGMPDGFDELPVAGGRMFLPPGPVPADPEGRFPLLVHFHGHPPGVLTNFIRSGFPGILVVLNESGLSSAYARPYRDPLAFEGLLAEVRTRAGIRAGRPVREGRLVVSSFSAGYGAVREILAQPAAGRVTDLVLADSLYAGWAESPAGRGPDPAQMAGFVRWAERAARGEVGMVVTCSEQVPDGYAGTWETAEVLRRAAGAEWVREPDLTVGGRWCLATADRGTLHLRHLLGSTADAHLEHLRRIAAAWRLLPSPR